MLAYSTIKALQIIIAVFIRIDWVFDRVITGPQPISYRVFKLLHLPRLGDVTLYASH